MKKTVIATTMVVTLLGVCAYADDVRPLDSSTYERTYVDRRFGIGAVFGEPTGVSAKYFLNNTVAIDAVVGWGFHDETDFYTHADVLWHLNDIFPVSHGRMPLYFGIGPKLKLQDRDDDRFGIRFPIGISYMCERAPVDIFVEVAPVLDVTPNTRGGFTAGVGIRYWF